MLRTRFIIPAIVISIGIAVSGEPRAAVRYRDDRTSIMSLKQQGRVRAPEFSGARGWLNTDKPLSIAGLRGKVVLLDFWTYGCINCIHIIPDLKRLEAKYPNQLVVIGVHSAKFENEREVENIRRIVLRYEIEHPVVNDAEMKIWEAYDVNAWPTQVLIDPAGYIIGAVSGEGRVDVLDRAIGETIAEFRKRGELNEQPLRLALERAKVGDLPLAFPGKVVADAARDRLFIADSNHNRIVVARLDGTLVDTIGTGERGATDGGFDRATFFRPQGMAVDNDWLYVADTENHLIRRIDLKKRTVETLAGTGVQSREYFKTGPARSIALNSPWDLHLVGRRLFIAMAGPHQIWQIDLDKNEVSTFAGSGREARADGDLEDAGFAQPSGITSSNNRLFIADSESNIIRQIGLGPNGQVRTLVGGDLFDFGDVDGEGDNVRLQHPLGIVAHEGRLFIADTYNHKIKELDPKNRTVRTFGGTRKPGQVDGKRASFYEPGGLAVANGKIFVADTNNHAIRVVELKTRLVRTLMIRGLQPPILPQQPGSTEESTPNAEEIQVTPQLVQSDTDIALVVNVSLPSGYHLNPAAPQRYKLSIDQESPAIRFASTSEPLISRISKDLKLPLNIPLRTLAPGKAETIAALTIYYCREDNTGTCNIRTLIWRIPIEVVASQTAAKEIRLQATVRE